MTLVCFSARVFFIKKRKLLYKFLDGFDSQFIHSIHNDHDVSSKFFHGDSIVCDYSQFFYGF